MSDQVEQLIATFQDLRTSRILSISSTVVLAYDIILTFPSELLFIWKAPWCGGKVLYLAGRYPILVVLISCELYTMGYGGSMFQFCDVMLYFRTWSIYVFSIPMQIVLTLRTWAIWERDLRVAAILIIAEAIYNVTVIVCDSILSKTYRYEPDALLGPLLDCYSGISGMSSTIVKVAFASLMIADAIVFVLILMRAIKEGRRTRTGILRVLVRDGAVYYAVLFAFSVGNLFLTTFLPLKRITLMGSLAPALLVAKSIGASHIVLNLREYFYGQQQMSELLSGINFGERRTILDEISRQVVFEPAVFDTQDEKPRGNLY